MKPNKDNKPIYRVKTLLHPQEQYTYDNTLFLTQSNLPDEMIGCGLENIVTGEYELFPTKVVREMKELGLILPASRADVVKDMIAPDFFEHVTIDLSFLDQYRQESDKNETKEK